MPKTFGGTEDQYSWRLHYFFCRITAKKDADRKKKDNVGQFAHCNVFGLKVSSFLDSLRP
jgi:hypothetical protein